MKSETISVLIPTRNRARTLSDVLKTSYLQMEGVEEVIVVDDASSDDTETVLAGFADDPRLQVVRNDRQRGLPESRNRAARVARGEFVLFGEDDLFASSHHAISLLDDARTNGFDVVAPRMVTVHDRSQVFGAGTTSLKDPICLDRMAGDYDVLTNGAVCVPFTHSCALMRRRLVLNYPYSSLYRGNAFREETDFYMRIRRDGYVIGMTPRVTAYHLKDEYTRGSGCGDNRTMKYRLNKHLNNLLFAVRNREQVKLLTGFNSIAWLRRFYISHRVFRR